MCLGSLIVHKQTYWPSQEGSKIQFEFSEMGRNSTEFLFTVDEFAPCPAMDGVNNAQCHFSQCYISSDFKVFIANGF
jgi:hypothetical protein